MSWWSAVRGVLFRPMAGRATPAPSPAAAVPSPTSASMREPAWPHLRTVQRALADPLRPTAPLDVFTGGLAAHRNPSFLAPLRHAVGGAEFAGLVNGLADLAPGTPHPYRGAGGLAVPASRRKPVVQRRAATWSALADGPPDADEVSLEPLYELPTEAGPTVFNGTGAPDFPLAQSPGALSEPPGALGEPPGALSLSKGDQPGALSPSKGHSPGALSSSKGEPPGALSPSKGQSPGALSPSKGQSPGALSPSTNSGEPQSKTESPEAAASVHRQPLPVARLHTSPTADTAVSVARIESGSPPPPLDPPAPEVTIDKPDAPEESAPVAPLTSQRSPLATATPIPSIEDAGPGETQDANPPASGVRAVPATELHAANQSSGAVALPRIPVQRTTEPTESPITRAFAAVPDQSARRPGWPAIPTRELAVARTPMPELTVARTVSAPSRNSSQPMETAAVPAPSPDARPELSSSDETDVDDAPVDGSGDAPLSGFAADAPLSGFAADAPLSGFAATIATLQRNDAGLPRQSEDPEPLGDLPPAPVDAPFDEGSPERVEGLRAPGRDLRAPGGELGGSGGAPFDGLRAPGGELGGSGGELGGSGGEPGGSGGAPFDGLRAPGGELGRSGGELGGSGGEPGGSGGAPFDGLRAPGESVAVTVQRETRAAPLPAVELVGSRTRRLPRQPMIEALAPEVATVPAVQRLAFSGSNSTDDLVPVARSIEPAPALPDQRDGQRNVRSRRGRARSRRGGHGDQIAAPPRR